MGSFVVTIAVYLILVSDNTKKTQLAYKIERANHILSQLDEELLRLLLHSSQTPQPQAILPSPSPDDEDLNN